MTDFAEFYEHSHAEGGMSKQGFNDDPIRMAFTAARYKHVARLLTGYKRVLEIGCADGYYSRIVRQMVGELDAWEVDVKSLDEAAKNMHPRWPINFMRVDILSSERFDPRFNLNRYDAAYALDVLEHINAKTDQWRGADTSKEHRFLTRFAILAPVGIIGMPSLESQPHASVLSRAGHINCKSGPQLKETLLRYYQQVFVFTMNDEALGTGFYPMAHYLLALCIRS